MHSIRRLSDATRVLLILAFILGLCGAQAYPCSTFVLRGNDELVFGANFDFYSSLGHVVVNKRGLAKTAFLAPPENPVSWVSRYGSITFNQLGREFPYGGMNEKGLVVQLMWLEGTGYPAADERPGVMELQWIQYHLDNSATVAEVLATDSSMRISGTQAMSQLHYLVCDRQGHVAAIEFLEGGLVYHTGPTLPVAALTNSTYDECEAFRQAYDTLSATEQIQRTSYASRDRFVRLAGALADFESGSIGPSVDYAFDVLQSVSATRRGQHRTAWSIVYDVRNLRLYFKTFENREPRNFALADFDFACTESTLILNMNQDAAGDVSGEFSRYAPEANRELVTAVIAEYNAAGFLVGVPEQLVLRLADYPDRVSCK